MKPENKNQQSLPLAIVNEVHPGTDSIIHTVQVKTANGTLERPVQHLYPLELGCEQVRDVHVDAPIADLNPNAPTFRPRRDAFVAARARIQYLPDDEQ